jgi:hypothetical protein
MNRHTVPAATANAKRKAFLANFVMRVLPSLALEGRIKALPPEDNAHPRSMFEGQLIFFSNQCGVRLQHRLLAPEVLVGTRLDKLSLTRTERQFSWQSAKLLGNSASRSPA